MMKVATLGYLRSGGKTLMIHRNKREQDMHKGKWNGLGGKLEPGETPEECIIREIREESGLTIKDPRFKGILVFPRFKTSNWYVFVFVAHEYEGELCENEEGYLEWIENDKLKDLNLWDGDYIFLDWLDRDGVFSAKFLYSEEGELVGHEVVFH
jgi:8-oxo-dGTP diphosphatase